MQARRLARELALLAMGQLPQNPEELTGQQLEGLLAAATQSLTGEVHDTLERAGGDLERAQQQLLGTEIQTTEVDVAGVTPAELNSARTTVKAVMELTQQAINHLGAAVQLPLLIQASNQKEVRSYAVELLSVAALRRGAVDEALNQAMEGWQVKRLAQVDRDLLRLAVVEMAHLGVPSAVAINEAVELAKRYSDQDGFRFINGVLRRWLSQFRAQLPKHSVPKS